MEAAKPAATKRNMTAAPGCNKSARRGKNPLTPRGDAGSVASMKQVLSLLLAFVFVQTQCWALSGGPNYGGSKSVSGTYAGVLTGIQTTAPSVVGGSSGGNSLGVFIIGVPEVNLAQGTIALFAEGVFYQGGIVGIVDPNNGKLSGIAQMIHVSSANTTSADPTGGGGSIDVSYDSRADGSITALIESTRSLAVAGASATLTGSGSFSVANLVFVPRLVTVTDDMGVVTTEIVEDPTFPPAGTLSFSLEGFKQSTQVVMPSANSIAALLNLSGDPSPATPVATF